jgi:predicted MFS family arabinose efflux permease
MASKARALERHGILAVVLVVCFVVGGYFTWLGYLGS